MSGPGEGPMMSETWWLVTRRYTVEDGVYVAAPNATEAKRLASEGEYDDLTHAEVVSATTYRKSDRLGQKPRHLWNEDDWEEAGE